MKDYKRDNMKFEGDKKPYELYLNHHVTWDRLFIKVMFDLKNQEKTYLSFSEHVESAKEFLKIIT